MLQFGPQHLMSETEDNTIGWPSFSTGMLRLIWGAMLACMKPLYHPQYTKASLRDTVKLPIPTRHDPGGHPRIDAWIVMT
jgi:hypothetical protein